MATGYTHGLTAETPFKKFALDCARAFGALIEMRDEPADAPVKLPEVSEYHTKALAREEARLAELEAMRRPDWVRAAVDEFNAAVESWHESRAKMQTKRAVYRRLIAETQAWMPPTAEHQGLRTFMLEQLSESDKWDNGPLDRPEKMPTQQTGDEWIASRLKEARRSIAYHKEEQAKELERIAERRQWIIDLQNSLPAAPATPEKEAAA